MKFTDDSGRAGKACHLTIIADDKAHETEQWANGGVTVEAESACYFNVLLAMKTAYLDTDGLNVAISLESSIMWVGTMLLTPKFYTTEFVTSPST